MLNLEDLEISASNVTVTTLKTTVLQSDVLNEESDEDRPGIYQKNSTEHSNSTVVILPSNDEERNSTEEVLIAVETVPLLIQEVYSQKDNYKLVIVTHNLLESGHNYTVDIKFAGNISNNLVGFYRTSYNDLDGTKR